MKITEEQITKSILIWLESNNWEIICFDFPQSGTGVSLHPNEENRNTKNKGAIIPDIVAVKSNVVVFFENKNRFVFDDFQKINEMRQSKNYSNSIVKLLNGLNYSNIYYGVGLPQTEINELKTTENIEMVDFVILLQEKNKIVVFHDAYDIYS